MPRGTLWPALATVASLAASASPVRAETWRELPPFEVAAYRFVTGARDATATFLNPAGLAGAVGSNLYLDASGDGEEILEGTAALQGGHWAFAYRHRDLYRSELGLPSAESERDNADAYVLAGALGPPKLRLGLSRSWTNVDAPGDDAGTWTAGILAAASDRVTLGGTIQNIEKPRFLDGRLRPRYTYAAEFALGTGDPARAAVTVEGSHLDGAADRVDLAGGVTVRFPAGLELGVLVRDRFDRDLEFAATVTHPLGPGTVSGRARSVSETDDVRGQVAIQLYDPFWKRAHGEPGTTRPGVPKMPRGARP
jgi:hypothetical protein